MFDSGNIMELFRQESQANVEPLEKGVLKSLEIKSDFQKTKLCPELATFKNSYLKDQKEYQASVATSPIVRIFFFGIYEV